MFLGLDGLTRSTGGASTAPGRPLKVLPREAVACLQQIESGGEALVGACHDGVRLCFSLGRYLRLLVFARFPRTQSRASVHFLSEKSRLKLARDLGRGQRLFLTIPCGSLKLSHSTPWASGSSAACLAHSWAISLRSIPWWLGYHRIAVRMPSSLARRMVIWPPGHDGVFLTWAWIVGGHSPDSRLCVREERDRTNVAELPADERCT